MIAFKVGDKVRNIKRKDFGKGTVIRIDVYLTIEWDDGPSPRQYTLVGQALGGDDSIRIFKFNNFKLKREAVCNQKP